MAAMPTRIDRSVYLDLVRLTNTHEKVGMLQEKAVDVMLAVDMVTMAAAGQYDAAYILSADGDFTPAVNFVRGLGKKVYAASPHQGAQLGAVGDAYIRIDKPRIADCYD